MKQNKYTFICEYKKGTYISQYMAEDLEQALDLWFVNLENPELTDKEKKVLKKKICPEWLPVSINDVDNVWCRSYIIEHKLLLLNIVKTAID